MNNSNFAVINSSGNNDVVALEFFVKFLFNFFVVHMINCNYADINEVGIHSSFISHLLAPDILKAAVLIEVDTSIANVILQETASASVLLFAAELEDATLLSVLSSITYIVLYDKVTLILANPRDVDDRPGYAEY